MGKRRTDQKAMAKTIADQDLDHTLPALVHENAGRIEELKRALASLLALCAFLLLMLSLRPFNASSVIVLEPVHGDLLNQVGFAIAGLVVALALTTLISTRLLGLFASPAWIGIALVLCISIVVAPDPGGAARSVILTLVGMLIAASFVLLPPSERAFQYICATAILLLLAINYLGVFLRPDLAIHGAEGREAQHAGLWRGHFAHKNLAGPVMSAYVMFGIYLWRSKFRFTGALIAILAFFFLLQTGSKTTTALLPIAILIVTAGRLLALPALTLVLYVVTLLGIGLLTIGTLYSPTLADVTAMILDDPTFTGRVTLWGFGIENIAQHLWFGTGYDSFWGTPTVTGLEFPYEAAWDFRGIIHGHNNYIDMLLTMGVIGAGVVFWALIVMPCIHYVRSERFPSNRNLADLFMMILVFMTLLSFLETFFLRRIDPMWLLMVIAIVGLQLTARFRVT